MTDIAELATDLAAEGDDLDGIVAALDDDGWRTPTPADGWTIAHQVAHLSWTDDVALLAATDAERFAERVR
ncbi:MAG TPA: maleylpyruvate isomerase N-terminal domain-containing protein, partial [Pseudonocardiaceae bacterium]